MQAGVLLAFLGVLANHKRVFRVYREAGLAVKRKQRKRLVCIGRPLTPVTQANEAEVQEAKQLASIPPYFAFHA